MQHQSPPAASPLQQQQQKTPQAPSQQQSSESSAGTFPFLSSPPADGHKVDVQQARTGQNPGKDSLSAAPEAEPSNTSPKAGCLSPRELVIPTFVDARTQNPSMSGAPEHKSVAAAPSSTSSTSLYSKAEKSPKVRRNTLCVDGKAEKETVSKKVMGSLRSRARIRTLACSRFYFRFKGT